MIIRTLSLCGVVLCACGAPGGGDGTGGGDGSSSVTCTPSASLKSEVSNGRTVVTATGAVSCSGATDLSLETCLQRDNGGTFTDVQCVSDTQSAVASLSLDSAAGCIGTATFRARVVVNGQTQTSAAQSVTCL